MADCKVNVFGVTVEYEQGTTYAEIAKDYKEKVDGDIILVTVNGKLCELHKKIENGCKIDFVTTKDSVGNDTYVRGAIFLMLKAFYNVLGREKIKKISVEHTLGKAVYCDYEGKEPLSNELLAKVKREMHEIADADLPILKKSIPTSEAIKMFRDLGMHDKEKLFKYRSASSTNYYELDGFKDYFYGYMPASTGILKVFDLMLYADGFLLLLPDVSDPSTVADYDDRPLLFKTQHEANEWGKVMGLETVGDLNEQICNGNIEDLLLVQEALQEKRIGDIAEQIKSRGGVKFVMIAGPSSSGKTTFSHRLSVQLRTLGLKPHPVALDNYFKNREDTPKDENGNYNFECLEAIDVEGFNKDMLALLNGETVQMPSFNFKVGKREYKGNTLKLEEGDILVLEGIHGLNDALSYSLPKESKFKIYISALTQLNIDEHNRIPTTTARLIRRIVRDARTRGTSAQGTIAMWYSVRRGEEENIFPFQEQADCMFNSALVYELAVLKQYVEPLLFGIKEDDPEYLEANKLLKFLKYFLGISSEGIPHNSIVREFVGGSVFPV
ncbi:MAG: nucleoside kinase [Lachnospiraceae bacterium]|nr:nucleoside kinase [Lachnospiraceae bacterium]MBR4816484.1 nucleoside kinase [Lachnospiraceae bacterium]